MPGRRRCRRSRPASASTSPPRSSTAVMSRCARCASGSSRALNIDLRADSAPPWLQPPRERTDRANVRRDRACRTPRKCRAPISRAARSRTPATRSPTSAPASARPPSRRCRSWRTTRSTACRSNPAAGDAPRSEPAVWLRRADALGRAVGRGHALAGERGRPDRSVAGRSSFRPRSSTTRRARRRPAPEPAAGVDGHPGLARPQLHAPGRARAVPILDRGRLHGHAVLSGRCGGGGRRTGVQRRLHGDEVSRSREPLPVSQRGRDGDRRRRQGAVRPQDRLRDGNRRRGAGGARAARRRRAAPRRTRSRGRAALAVQRDHHRHRAYAVRQDLITYNRRLLDYVRDGGNLIVLYNTQELDPRLYAPYPGSCRGVPRKSRRVVAGRDPRAVGGGPQHANRITPPDFDNWVEQRGSKFWSSWDQRYTPILATWDRGQAPQKGGWLHARVGKGALHLLRLRPPPPAALRRARRLPHPREPAGTEFTVSL